MCRATCILLLFATAFVPAIAAAKYPILSRMTRTNNGPYQPQVRRYMVVDPIPPAGAVAGHAAPHGHGHHQPVDPSQLWRRYDLATPVYPYGYFGARHANERYTRGSYYDNYEDTVFLRGR